ncbi:hypothetical protein [Streptomyces sp. NPDC049970]|uniref:hypothetical protein n=1 Tax=Streptomyces sp. NPDC049970 TaxID=3155033 RepID=UPI003429348C
MAVTEPTTTPTARFSVGTTQATEVLAKPRVQPARAEEFALTLSNRLDPNGPNEGRYAGLIAFSRDM